MEPIIANFEGEENSGELHENWKQWVGEADKNGKISGNIKINGMAVANAKIHAQLRLTYSSSAHTMNGTHIIPLRKLKLSSISDDDGSFEIANLCKGTYELTIELPNQEAIKRRVLLGSNDDHQKLSIE